MAMIVASMEIDSFVREFQGPFLAGVKFKLSRWYQGKGLCEFDPARHSRDCVSRISIWSHGPSCCLLLFKKAKRREPMQSKTRYHWLQSEHFSRLAVQHKPAGASTDAHRDLNILYGTSISTPHLSGIAKLLKAAHPD
ncbi:hypothetical protein AMTR_s00044p00119110 [Amborella trichopoda]|uniref:Peptidase S8/S53 domain-containing protein n=1 Tax=Amborella trichopoda TaxID=13333 RepID=U5D3W6_AMBTC|nr:hypothetical protein AMTR_s00044p00119110 [Amborella trichopoda]